MSPEAERSRREGGLVGDAGVRGRACSERTTSPLHIGQVLRRVVSHGVLLLVTKSIFEGTGEA